MYVYCAVHGAVKPRELRGLPALPDAAVPRLLPLDDGLSLVVADVPARMYAAQQVEARLADLDWVGRCGSAHHAVADALVEGHTVLPLRPFTLFSREDRARAAFSRRIPELRGALDRVRGRTEWVLRISKPDPALTKRDDQEGPAQPRPASGAAFLAQKSAARREAAELASRVQRETRAVFESLAAVADAADRRDPERATGLLLDAAFLVRGTNRAAFKRSLEAAARPLLRDGCRISLTGPWPPYSFVSLTSSGEGE